MEKSELNSLKNELKQIYDKSITVINQEGFLDKNQVPSGKKVYNIETTLMFMILGVQQFLLMILEERIWLKSIKCILICAKKP